MKPFAAPTIVVNSSLPHTWDHIRKIRKQVGDALQDSDPNLRSAAMMVTSELVENAVKYGEEVPAAPHISLSMTVNGEQLVIVVTNGCADLSGVRELQKRIDEITAAPDKSTLYMARLEELLADPSESGKLGLYRIAFEGQFEIDFRYTDQVVSITATRLYQ